MQLIQHDPLDVRHVDTAWVTYTVDSCEDDAAVEVPRCLMVELSQVLDAKSRLQRTEIFLLNIYFIYSII